MVHFGHYILANRIPEWESHYIGYKALKKRINEYASRASHASSEEREQIISSFAQLLDSQVERIVLFLMEKQGLLAEKLLKLAEKQEKSLAAMEIDVEAATSYHLIEEYRAIGQELLKLLNFVEMNTTGLRKILKKFDKRVGFRFREQYLASRINHPYSQLQQVFKQVGIGALMGTIAQNLAQLSSGHSHRQSYFSLFRKSSLPIEHEPIIKALEGALHRLTKEVTFMSFVANDLLLPEPSDHALETADEREFHFMSVQLNLWNTFLYMANYYIVVPTSDDYAETLHVPGTMNGVIIGAMPLAALVSALVYSWWSNFSYRAPLFISTLLLMAGNLMYALALPFHSFWFLVIGRALSGLGGARAINRRYLMDHVPVKHLTNVSASFVIASSLGMAAGPALASLLIKLDFQMLGFPVNQFTAPGWVMLLLWGIYLIVSLFAFKEPKRLSVNHDTENQVHSAFVDDGSDSGSGITDPLLGEETVPAKGRKPAGTISELFRAINTPVQILLLVYFMLKFAVEMLVSESGIISEFYFQWSSSQVGYFLGALGLAVLPICAVVANYISNTFADRVVIFWTEILIALGVIANICYYPLFRYTTVQYVASAIVIFLSTNVLEGVNMSLLSKVMPSRLSRGVFNCGFLSTEAGTLARALSDGLISLAGKAGMEYLLIVTMIPTLVLVLATIACTWIGYYTLY
ncbi:SPX domain-containing membrane protein At4g22990 [Selaginella moellendorffii]|uniref:SPX domain-containing membrane protein At4g22990 n=1 Tax=Selaginella moellendorffii TaxID=88036 RepID=UPI000D1C6549|nr:SPX domain-containing membrane protein At4g22990 [Selaginella moellendorffii]|eukprot:XP_024536249.1 SPX domain-containing membrane protein At4g22990 [Selaginella moellendorffii]